MPRIKRPRIASPDEVRITREGETAIIEFADSTIATIHLTMGPKIHGMTNAEILTLFNQGRQRPIGMPSILTLRSKSPRVGRRSNIPPNVISGRRAEKFCMPDGVCG